MSGGENVNDADLIRYLHAELEDDELARIGAQVATSAVIGARARALHHRELRLSSLLGAMDPAPAEVQSSANAIRDALVEASAAAAVERTSWTPHSWEPIMTPARMRAHEHWWRRVPRPLQVAAAVAVLLGSVLLVEPARAWVIENVRALVGAVGFGPAAPADRPDDPASDPATTPVDPQSSAAVRISFPWTTTAFAVEAGRARGTIVARRGSAGRVTAESTAGVAAEITVTPRGIRIEGSGEARAEFVVSLPPDVTTLRLVSGGLTTVHDLPTSLEELRLPLR